MGKRVVTGAQVVLDRIYSESAKEAVTRQERRAGPGRASRCAGRASAAALGFIVPTHVGVDRQDLLRWG